MTYDEVVTQVQTILEIPLNQEDNNFQRIIPQMFAYADTRIYTELDFLITTMTLLGKVRARKRDMELPPEVLVLRQVNVCTPNTVTVTDTSERHTLERITPEALDMFWPASSPGFDVPKKYALVGSAPMAVALQPLKQTPPIPPIPQRLSYLVRFMPTPDQGYPVEFLGVIRPAPLSQTNPETFLSIAYPALLCAACAVFGFGYQRDYGGQADDPAKAMSWETQYQYLKQGIMMEAAKMRGVTVQPPSVATPGAGVS